VIISGGSRCNGAWFASHLTRTDENERVRLVEIRSMAAEDIPAAFREMHFVAGGTFCKNYFYHASINPRENERLSEEQWERAADALERNLGLEGQPRFVVEHEKEGRVHRHIVWSRIDAETMTAISDSFTAPIHERTARELEQEFGLEPVASCLTRERGTPRPERGPKSWEKFRGFESGIDPDEVKREVTALWQQCDSGKAFARALDEAGYILCKGDRRDFCIVDAAGDEHSLARRIKGVKAADIRERMADVVRDELPTVDEARDLADERADAASSSSSSPHHIEPGKLLEAEKPRPRPAEALRESGTGDAGRHTASRRGEHGGGSERGPQAGPGDGVGQDGHCLTGHHRR
jgi:Relaxase/Mobilisation nuclease domain